MGDYTLKQLEEEKEDLIGRYIGTFDKPQWYYNSLEILNKEIYKLKNKPSVKSE